ncbi:hypothetical protein [Candidatus Entotheonella palauensis]|uniref:Carboxypeptidase regulatory-like domain-containing protein n=1 Tax=Candidatus Entotheonella gemina TaxID=1429439 RepID=W4LSG5_9BACT|nr:hypothetical protein [Candidatus Entotheonella palauensis]ETX00790.1 MAG: hypothetical protein ETSY2_38450 [Candidatus Entotheonella gemina]
MKRMLTALSIVLLSAMFILGCDGGEDISDASANVTSTPEETVVLNGIVVTDDPLGSMVQAINTRGETSDEAPVDAKGHFSLDIDNDGPYMLRLIHRDREDELFSFATSAGHVNLTPLTHLAMYIAIGDHMALQDLFHEWDGSQLSPEEVQMAAATVNANLAPLLNRQGLDHRTYDFFRTDFKSDGTGMDAVLDTVRIHIDPAETLSRSIQILDASGSPLLTFDLANPAANTPASSAIVQQKEGESQ